MKISQKSLKKRAWWVVRKCLKNDGTCWKDGRAIGDPGLAPGPGNGQ